MTREEKNEYQRKWAREKFAKDAAFREKSRLRSAATNRKIRGGLDAFESRSLAGKKFGKLTVIKQEGYNKRGKSLWLCNCSCGKINILKTRVSLQDTVMPSCGCFIYELPKTHGETSGHKKTTEYGTWASMKDRCLNENDNGWKDYGGRGIKVCQRWIDSYEDFLSDMGRKPTINHSLDRFPDTNGNYEPSNCRWATKKQQSNNTRRTVRISYNGVTKSMKEWSVELGMTYSKIMYWLRMKKISFEELIILHANSK